jgi:hypothetical protein
MELLVIALIIGFVVLGLERNKTHNRTLAGSTDIQDRDQERLSIELTR